MRANDLPSRRGSTGLDPGLEELYLRFLEAFYVDEDRERSSPLADQLTLALERDPEFAASIRGDEIRSLVAEFRGDLSGAIKNREAEIRRIFTLHSLVQGKPGAEYVFKKYDHEDISERLDILATLYAARGEYPEALSILEESRRYCASRGIPFEGDELIADYLPEARPADPRGVLATKSLDAMIIEAYRRVDVSWSEILVDDDLGRRFHEEVARLTGPSPVSAKSIKTRLLGLSRKGEAQGGLPRRRHSS